MGNGNYRAQITHQGMGEYLGTYRDCIEAAKSYDRAAISYFGEFASLNFARSDYT